MTLNNERPPVPCELHHAHLFARDLGASISFYQEMFGAEVVFDDEVAGARNVLHPVGYDLLIGHVVAGIPASPGQPSDVSRAALPAGRTGAR